ncbi:hypothetical protein PtA15_16A401 [Puccinia triticina]|uniref:Uncharacterized protein n=1 Tax=Puccinia triticina TaxID=208348 RepID=A0ABY7D5Y5_9BASI|nr:uncharacterized protein PtA15_16A401 [Puccinia triticina]WAQ92493.1 hypothetical protein PtA15_16A401 [Puccinia triticina]WAR64238.1 hypothetical protein PtB15_16B398 [Puccinia triticina]
MASRTRTTGKRPWHIITLSTLLLPQNSHPQTISTNMPLPPMEWIKLSPAGTTSPPALSHGCLSGPTYNDPTSSLPGFNQAFLFGGRSAAGTANNGLFILDYASDTPRWSQPAPTTSTIFTSSPQPRSHLLCGWDSASNFRNQLNIYGGRSEDGQPLGDFWYYDPTNRFWAQPKDLQPTDHPPNYGALGGIDPSYLPAPPGTSNAIIYLGGANGSHATNTLTPSALSIDGQLGSNTNTITVNLTSLAPALTGNPAANNLYNGRWGATGTIMPGSKLVVFSGCNDDPGNEFRETVDPSCSLTNGGILSFESGFTASQLPTRPTPPRSSWAAFNYCPAPRVGGTMVANRNRFDSSYANQAIMIGGRTDSKNWDDQGGAKAGEVDVLDISSGVWARVLPMRRDNATFTQKEGLLALALPSRIGPSSASSDASRSPTDILVYGGIDTASGQASNELWILRLHPAKLTGNGTADGVTMAYMPSCVTPTPQNKRNTSKTTAGGGVPGSGSDASPGGLEAPSGHLIFSAVALAILMISLTVLRCEEPGKLSIRSRWRTPRLWLLIGAWHTLVTSCGLLALAVVVALFETRVSLPALSLARRGLFSGHTSYAKLGPKETLARSTHARLGLAIAIVGFVLVPALYLLSWLDESLEARRKKHQQSSADAGPRKLKAKGSPGGAGLTRRALERMVLLGRQPFGAKQPANNSSKEGSFGTEKQTDLADQHHSVPSTRPSSKRPPLAGAGSHEGHDSTSTSNTSTQLLSAPPPAEEDALQETLAAGAAVARKPSPSKLKLDHKPPERPLVRSPFAKVFHYIPGRRGSGSDPTDGHSSPAASVPSSAAPSPGFEVLNRRPPPRRPRPRASLDIMSDAGSSSSLSGDIHGRPSFSSFQHQQQVAQQIISQGQQPHPGSVAGGGVGKRSTIGSRLHGLSFYGGSQAGTSVAHAGGPVAGYFHPYPHPDFVRAVDEPDPDHPGSLVLYDSHRLWAHSDDDHLHPPDLAADPPGPDGLPIRDSYLVDREVQIVTTAPKRVLAVVNR